MSEMLPKGWVKTTIGSLGTISTGNTPSRRDGTNYGKGIPFVRPGDLGNGAVVTNTSEMLSEKGAKSARLLAPNAVMITCIGNLGKVGIAGRTLCTNQQINSVQFFKDYIVSRFGYYRCLRLKEWLEQQSSATTLPIVNKSRFSAAPFPLPPLNEQKRIAAKLDKIIPRIDKVKERLDKIPVITKRFRQSVLAAAVTGKLTEEWREENPDVERSEGKEIVNIKIKFDVPSTWDFRKLDEFIQEIKAGKNFSCPEIPVNSKTVGLVKISAVTWDKFDHHETKTVQDKSKIDDKLFIKEGDFLISRANTIELVGASVIVEEIEHKIMLSDKVWRVTFHYLNEHFINYFLKSYKGRDEIESRSSGNQQSMRNMSQKAFRDIDFPLPPLEEQKEIVRQIDNLFTLADRLAEHYQKAKAKVDKLSQSVLAKAFRGEMVPQDPNDEPAEKLLERIMEEKGKMVTELKKAKKKVSRKKN